MVVQMTSIATLTPQGGGTIVAPHTADKAGGGYASDGMVAVRVASVKTASVFDGNAAGPGSRFVIVTLQVKNLSDVALPCYKIESRLSAGTTRADNGRLYDATGDELGPGNATPLQTLTFLDVFAIGASVKPDTLIVHVPFAVKTAPDLTFTL